VLQNVHAHFVGSSSVTPDHHIVADSTAGWVVERTEYRIPGVFGNVDVGDELLDFLGADDFRIHALGLIDFGTPAHGAHTAVIVRQRHVAHLGKHQVEIQFTGELFIQFQGTVVEPHTIWRQVVGTQN